MPEKITTREIHLRHTSASGDSYVAHHIVHDADKFLAARQAEAKKLNAEQPKGEPRLAKVELITPEQYANERKTQ